MSRPCRLIVTGSRAWTDAQVLREVLDIFAEQAAAAGVPELIVAHGAAYPKPDRHTGRIPARSADWLTHRWIHDLPHPLPVTEEAHPADWSAPCRPTCRHRGRRRQRTGSGTYCPTAGNYRNAEKLVAPGADAGAVFLLDDSPGTTDCWRRMQAAGIPCTPVVRRSPTLSTPAGVDSPSPTTA